MTENWKKIKGYEGIYEISNLGSVKSVSRIKSNQYGNYFTSEKILSPATDRNGYKYVYLTKNGKSKFLYVHRLVAMMFVENIECKNIVNHINGIKTDNGSNNLEWVTKSENTLHAYKSNLMGVGVNIQVGEKNTSSKLKEADALRIRELFNQGMKCLDITKLFQVNNSTVDRIIKRKTWKHI